MYFVHTTLTPLVKTNTLFTVGLLCIGQLLSAQCPFSFEIEQFDPCVGAYDISTISDDCTDAAYFTYGWYFSGLDGTLFQLDSGTAPELNMIPSAFYPTELQLFGYFQQTIWLDVQAWDGNDMQIGQWEAFESVLPPLDLVVDEEWLLPSCGGNCYTFVPGLYWSLDASITIDGNVYDASTDSPICLETPETYEAILMDANGCSVSQEIEVTAGEADNATCATAVPLTSGTMVTDDICNGDESLPQCSDWFVAPSNWFVINSEDYAFMELGIQPLTLDSLSAYNITVYAGGNGCDDLEVQSCLGSALSSCYDFGDTFSLQPDTDYYIEYHGAQGAVFELVVQLYSADDYTPLCGCSDPDNCLYNPEALIDTGCGLEGCSDPGACNYQAWASCDDGSCTFGDDLSLQLFQDINGNGWWDGGFFGEAALGNTGSVSIEELGITIYLDSDGQVMLPEVEQGVYTLSYADPNGIWELPGGPIQLTIPTCNGLQLGLVTDEETLLQVSGPCCIWMMDLHCEFGMNPGLWVQNLGATPLNGTFTMTFDPLLIPEFLTGAEPYDSYSPGVLVWEIDNQLPGESVLYQCHIQGPGVDVIGEVFPLNMALELVDASDEVVFADNWILNPEVVCAYDPNDKYAVPEGYTEEHFILEEQVLEYRIRFQNTGNFPAAVVRIEDQLDVEHLDLETFTPVFASHDFSTVLHPDGLIEFTFDDIQLPALEDDEPGSQGYVVYRVKPKADVSPGSVINNTASIFFDGNPPIITNTTWHTIFDCAWMEETPDDVTACEGDISLFVDVPYAETWAWQQDWEDVPFDGPNVDLLDMAPGTYSFAYFVSNPLCTVGNAFELQVNEAPAANITADGNILFASAGDWYQWFFNGVPIEGAEDQTYTVTEIGTYNVAVGDDFGCSSYSEGVTIVGIQNWDALALNLLPNPAEDWFTVDGLEHPVAYTLSDLSGRIVQEGTAHPGERMDVSALVSGHYRLALRAGHRFAVSTLVVR